MLVTGATHGRKEASCAVDATGPGLGSGSGRKNWGLLFHVGLLWLR